MLDVVAAGVAIEVVIGLPVIRMGSADYTLIWRTAQALGPALIVLGGGLLIARRPDGRSRVSRDSLLLFLLLAGFMSLLQFPFSAPVYFCYVAPLLLLAAIAALTHSGLHRGAFPTTILAIFVLFG